MVVLYLNGCIILKSGEIYLKTGFVLPPGGFIYTQTKDFGNIFTVLLIKNTCECWNYQARRAVTI